MSKNKKLQSDLMLLLTSLIWGSSFIFQSLGANHLGPFTFNTFRYVLAVISLLPAILYFKKKNSVTYDFNYSKPSTDVQSDNANRSQFRNPKVLITGGVLLGMILFIAGNLQQYAMAFTTSGKAGFITTLYVIIVPILGIFLGNKTRLIVWFCALLAAVGLYFLSIKPGSFTISKGDFFILLCAIGFSFHILLVDHISPKVDSIVLSCIQFAVVASVSGIAMISFETFTISQLVDAIIPLLCTGVLSSSVGFTFQIIAQKHADPTVASLILSLEAVFAAICGAIFLGEVLNAREITGCALMFAAIIISQLPAGKSRI